MDEAPLPFRGLFQEQSDYWGVFCALVIQGDLCSALYLAHYAASYVLGLPEEVA